MDGRVAPAVAHPHELLYNQPSKVLLHLLDHLLHSLLPLLRCVVLWNLRRPSNSGCVEALYLVNEEVEEGVVVLVAAQQACRFQAQELPQLLRIVHSLHK